VANRDLRSLRDVAGPVKIYWRVSKFSEFTGYTEKAVYEKVRMGVWQEGKHYVKAPDGALLVDYEEYTRWAAGGRDLG
jgi:hypothetical protein